MLTFDEADAVCRERFCRAVRSPGGVTMLEVVWVHAPAGKRGGLRTIEGRLDNQMIPRWPAIDVLRACRRVRRLDIPSSTPPDGLPPHRTLDEAAIAAALAADGIAVYHRSGGRTEPLRRALGEDSARPRNPDKLLDVMVLCGLARRVSEDSLSARFVHLKLARRPRRLPPSTTKEQDAALRALYRNT